MTFDWTKTHTPCSRFVAIGSSALVALAISSCSSETASPGAPDTDNPTVGDVSSSTIGAGEALPSSASTTTPESTSASISSSYSSSPSIGGVVGSFQSTGPGGDKLNWRVTSSGWKPFASANFDLSSCESILTRRGSSPDRSAVVDLQVTGALASSMSIDAIDIEFKDGGHSWPSFRASRTEGVVKCDEEANTVLHWRDIQPGGRVSGEIEVIIPGFLSPNEPKGDLVKYKKMDLGIVVVNLGGVAETLFAPGYNCPDWQVIPLDPKRDSTNCS